MSERVRFAVVHGRFQPFHLEHLAYCELALRRGDALVVGITNFDPALSEVEVANPRRHELAANPFSYWERTLMIRDALLQAGVAPARFMLVALPIHHPERWPHYVPTDPRQALHILRVFSAWEEEKARRLAAAGWRVEAIRGEAKAIAATEVRARIAADQPWEHLVPEAVSAWIMRLDGAARLRRLNAQAESSANGK